MAQEKESNKTFGGTSVPAGNYIIHSAFIGDDWFKNAAGLIVDYDTLEVIVINEGGQFMSSTLKLNGCWNKRKGSDGNAYQASGSFYDRLIKSQTGKSFSEVRDFINTNLTGFKIGISYKDYPTSNGFGHVPIINIDTTTRTQVPQLPTDWKPIKREKPAEAQPAAIQPTAQTSQPSDNLPF